MTPALTVKISASCTRVSYDSRNEQHFFLSHKERLSALFIVETHCEIGTQVLNAMQKKFVFQKVNNNCIFSSEDLGCAMIVRSLAPSRECTYTPIWLPSAAEITRQIIVGSGDMLLDRHLVISRIVSRDGKLFNLFFVLVLRPQFHNH